MVAHMGYGTFVFFGLMCILGAAFVAFFVPETKNLTLEEMDEVFGDEAGNAVKDKERLERIYRDLGLLGDGEGSNTGLDKGEMTIGGGEKRGEGSEEEEHMERKELRDGEKVV